MNWVAPIKDEETLEKFKAKLREMDDKYYIMFEIGVGTGLQLQEILKFRNKDIRGKDSIEANIGTKNIRRTFQIPPELKQIINDYTEGKDPEAYLILGHASSPAPLSREQAYRAFKNAGKSMGLTSIGAQTMRKTFAWILQINRSYLLSAEPAEPCITVDHLPLHRRETKRRGLSQEDDTGGK